MKRLLVLILVLFAVKAYADGKADTGEKKTERDIIAVIEKNLQAAEEEDFEAFMSTYHERARMCGKRGAEMKECFRRYDMSYDLEKAKVLDRCDDEAKVLFVQINRKVRGPDDLKDRRVTGIHVMKKCYGKWKIYDTEIKQIQDLQ